MATESGASGDDAAYAMWDDNIYAWTFKMRLGDSGRQLKALATFACFTFRNSDGLFWSRWGNAFSGGLKIGVGAHDVLYVANDAVAGQNFASYMVEGVPIGSSWLESVYYANNGNHPMIANTGANSSDCWSRQDVKLNNLMSEKVLRDGAIGYVCWTNWN